MQGLLLRLSTLDADAESAVRVIAYFDSLVRDHASVSGLIQATARLAQCPAGLLDGVSGRRHRVAPGGSVTSGEPPAAALRRELGSGQGTVWMEREGDAHGLDEIVLERFASAAEVILERAAAPAWAVSDPALVELVLSEEAGDAERSRALRLLGFDPAAELQVLATPAAESVANALVARLRAQGLHARATRMDDIAAIVTVHLEEPLPADALPAGARVGVGPPVTGAGIARSWAGARYALRFTGPDPADRVVEYAGLGALALFAHVPVEAIAELADVQALEKLARMPNGAEALAAVRALCAEGSVRRAAAAVHLHHSSMAGRIARAEAVLGYSLADPAGRLRAHLALALVRLRANVSEAAPGATPPRARPRPGD